MSEFENNLLNSIASDIVDNDLGLYLDEILLWYVQINTDRSSVASNKALKKYGEQELKLCVEKLIDKIFISLPMAAERLFPLKMNESEVKERYRRLIRVFHPDRGSNDQVWLNRRAEIINVSFEEHNKALVLLRRSQLAQDQFRQNFETTTDEPNYKNVLNIVQKQISVMMIFFRKHPCGGGHRYYQRVLVISAATVLVVVFLLGLLSTFDFKNSHLQASVSELDKNFLNDDVKQARLFPLAMREIMEPESLGLKILLETKDTEWGQINLESLKTQATASDFIVSESKRAKIRISSNSKFYDLEGSKKNKELVLNSSRVTIKNEVIKSTFELLKLKYSVNDINDLLNQYRRAFTTGDITQMMDLYLVSAVHDGKRGRLKIEHYFQKIFHRTSTRSATLTPSFVFQEDDSGVLIEGVLEMKMRAESQQLEWSNSKRFRLVLVRHKEKLKISSFVII